MHHHIDVNPEMAKALSVAKIGLMTRPNSVFFASACMALEHFWTDRLSTAGTDGLRVGYNPDFFMPLTKEQRIGLILHEVLHVVGLHNARLGTRDPGRWNEACDYAINLIILRAGFELPPGGLVNWDYEGMAPEQIYGTLPVQEEPSSPEAGTSPAGIGNDLLPAGIGGDEPGKTPEEVKLHVDNILVQAVAESRRQNDAAGTIPGHLERHVDQLLNPIVPWHRLLRNYFTARAKSDYSYTRPNRRYFPDFFMPTLYSEAPGEIAEAVDSSGSTSDESFAHYVSEAKYLIKNIRPKKLTLIQFDTDIKSADQLQFPSDFKRLKFTGRGGTDVNPVLQWAKDNKPTVMIIFTDGWFHAPKVNPKIPVIWVIDSNPDFTAPFGKVIHFNFAELKAQNKL